MLNDTKIERVYLAQGNTDLLKSIDGLAALVKEGFDLDPFSPSYFVFCNRNRDKLKILHWDRNGFWLYYRRLERGKFHWPSADGEATLTVDYRQLRWLLDGLPLEQRTAHSEVTARPKELDQLREKVVSELVLKTPSEVKKIQDTIHNQQQQMQVLRQENGRLSHKLGEAYKQMSQLEQERFTVSDEVRNKDDILKIQHLKGLIEELKSEIDRLSMDVVQEEEIEEVGLTDEPIEQEVAPLDIILKGKNILILGGYRRKQTIEEKAYTIYTHDTRTIDPAFYDLLKKADIIVILTRYVSHRAMWEAKEFAILEQKPIYYTTFTNIPAILSDIVRERS